MEVVTHSNKPKNNYHLTLQVPPAIRSVFLPVAQSNLVSRSSRDLFQWKGSDKPTVHSLPSNSQQAETAVSSLIHRRTSSWGHGSFSLEMFRIQNGTEFLKQAGRKDLKRSDVSSLTDLFCLLMFSVEDQQLLLSSFLASTVLSIHFFCLSLLMSSLIYPCLLSFALIFFSPDPFSSLISSHKLEISQS